MNTNFSKTIIAGFAMLFCLGTGVNAQSNLCLREVNSQMEGDYTYYGYNKDGRLDSVYTYMGYYDEESYRLYAYDDKGNMISETGYGVLPSTNVDKNVFSKVFEVFYDFDDSNRMISRRNYNIDEFSENLDFYLGGVYTYEYNEKGQLAKRNLYWDEAKKDLFEITTYQYDDKNQLVKEVYVTKGFYGETEDMNVEYYYDEQGRNIKKLTKTLDPNSGALEESANVFFEFDEDGNLISRTMYDDINPDIPSQQHKLIYGDKLAEDFTFPINYEDDMDFFVKSKHVVKQDSIYMRDAEGVVFQLFDIQDWGYDELEGSTGIENVVSPGVSATFARDNDGNIVVNGIDASENIRIYDVNGKIMRNGCYNGRVDVSALPKGMYILVTRNGNMKFSK